MDESFVPEIPGLPSYQELHQAVAEIEAPIEQYDPLDLIANFAFENLAYSTGPNRTDDGGQAFVEYLVMLCLKTIPLKGMNRSIPPRSKSFRISMAERVGFEPTLPFRVNTLSKRAPSATRPSLRDQSAANRSAAGVDVENHCRS
jgi:hypothetical protein